MNLSEIDIKVTLKSIKDAPLINAWSKMCDKYGINEWCLNEGLANENDTVTIKMSDACLWGIVKNDCKL